VLLRLPVKQYPWCGVFLARTWLIFKIIPQNLLLIKKKDLCYVAECLWKVKCKDYRYRTKMASAYEILIQKLQEVDPEANRHSVVKDVYDIIRSYLKKHKTGSCLDEIGR
jgi:hypothetical protein